MLLCVVIVLIIANNNRPRYITINAQRLIDIIAIYRNSDRFRGGNDFGHVRKCPKKERKKGRRRFDFVTQFLGRVTKSPSRGNILNEFCNKVSTLNNVLQLGRSACSPYSVKVEGARDDVPVRMRANANREIRTQSAIGGGRSA